MKIKSLLCIALGTTVLTLTACGGGKNGLKPGPAETARIMEMDKSEVALLLNKGFSTSIVAINNGKKIKPCKVDGKADAKARDAAIKACYPDGHNPDGKILFKETAEITVKEGTICVEMAVGSHVYVLCQPPLDLGF